MFLKHFFYLKVRILVGSSTTMVKKFGLTIYYIDHLNKYKLIYPL